MKGQLVRFPDTLSMARGAAEQIVILAQDAIQARGQFSIALSGGFSPRPLYEVLATDDFAPRIDWTRTHIFWSDERCVPPDHIDSNYRMARERLLDHIPLPEQNAHRMQGEIDPAQAAANYEHTLRLFFGTETPPRFDVLLLGMGGDGHTASLFPGTAVLHETTRWVAENYVEKHDSWRITLTPIVINAAANILFLITGEDKLPVLREVLYGAYQPELYPSQLVNPENGYLQWLLDESTVPLEPDNHG
jgi:6-phosphogluconolactonase